MRPETIAGRYRVVRVAGRGGMGTVWLCHDEVLGREVAVKQVGVLPGESVPDLARAMREARSSAALNHPNVVSVFDTIEADDHIWLVMEHVAGSTLSALIAREGPLDPVRVAGIGAQVADGLAAAHARGTVHRDVKPGNVLVGAGDVAKISDFGIARTDGDAQLTRSGLVTGTPLYFSPELARGADPSPASDVWALGATLYTAVEGHPPTADRGNAIATLAAIAESRPPRPEHAGFLADAIGRMLDPDPGSRWSMSDAAHALRRLHDQHRPAGTLEAPAPAEAVSSRAEQDDRREEPPEPATPAPATTPRPKRRRRSPALAVAVVVLLVLAAVVGGVLLLDQRDEPTRTAGGPGGDAGPGDATSHSASEPTGDPSTTAPSPSPASAAPPATGRGAERAVVDYYALLPDDTAAAWDRLSPDLQKEVGGYDRYDGFWRTIDAVRVDDTSSDDGVVTVDLTYTKSDGRVESETRELEMTEADGGWMITGDSGP
jgi:hypothetical protein